MILRPQTFGSKLLALFVLVVLVAQFATWFLVSRFHLAQAHALITDELQRAARAFMRVVDDRNKLLTVAANFAARDYPTRQLFASDDPATLASALENIRIFSGANIVAGLALDGHVLASTSPLAANTAIGDDLVRRAEADPSPNPTATGYGYLDGQLYSLVVVPVRTPDIIAWMLIGFRIDREFAEALKRQTGVDLTFLDHTRHLLATTLDAPVAQSLATALPRGDKSPATFELDLGRETAVVALRPFQVSANESSLLVLQYSLDEKLRPARATERWMLGVALVSLAFAAWLSRMFAHRLTRPIIELVARTRRIARGDYALGDRNYRTDELGRLAEAFDQMSAGLAERDRVRDLLDKNVSPEIAAQLLRDGATLGGQEREVTILFADLRGFTTMSEKFAPRDLLALLNRYLDRMSREVEVHGGVIDKFIGDAIMALFGAPVAQGDAADRAIASALAMERALVELNAELAAEGRAPLAIGIGINTAHVVAGNIGSQRRLNYSVIGDGVNVAARIQALTRTSEYRTNIITSAETLAATRDRRAFVSRALGSARVKGRAEPVEIFAVENPTSIGM